jgi:LPS O-antigen subunit length determinant protein (WzzB/FepE family)
MPSSVDNSQTAQDFWPSIVRIIILEIVLLIALSAAFICYLNWSSEAAVSEFMTSGSPSLQAVKDRPPCGGSA